jgi:RNA polymerase sigma factor (sigma-70 family)
MPSRLRTKAEQNVLLLKIHAKARSFAIGEVNPDDVDDITSEVVLHCLARLRSRKWRKLPKNLQAFVRKLTSDTVATFYRKEKSKRGAEREFRRARRLSDPEWMSADALEQEASIADLQADILKMLPQRCRQAYELVRMQDASYKEAARCMGVSTATVGQYIVQAQHAFRDVLHKPHVGKKPGGSEGLSAEHRRGVAELASVPADQIDSIP